MTIHHVRRGSGPKLLLVHGLGGTWRSWEPILEPLTAQREVIAIDLPGFGETPALSEEPTIPALADAVDAFLIEQDLVGIDATGSSMGARLVMELARRGSVSRTVPLDPGGFWTKGQRRIFGTSVGLSVKLVRLLQPIMGFLTGNPVTRTLLLAQFSGRPWALERDVILPELRSFAATDHFDDTLGALTDGPQQRGAPAGTLKGSMVIGWGKRDLVTLPSQSKLATELFPDATVHWFEKCGHFPYWDQPAQTAELVLANTG